MTRPRPKPAQKALAALGIFAAAVAALRLFRARGDSGRMADAPDDVRQAARHLGYHRRARRHPVDSIDAPPVAIAALGVAFLQLDAPLAPDRTAALGNTLQRELALPPDNAEALISLGHWLVSECGGTEPAVTRLALRLYESGGAGTFEPLMRVIKATAEASSGLSPPQAGALDDIKRAFRIS